jgi:hypothetical protein
MGRRSTRTARRSTGLRLYGSRPHATDGETPGAASVTHATRFRRTLTAVAATLNEDKLAIDVYSHAEATGQPVTLGLVERRLDELRSHDPDCGCGLCTACARGSKPRTRAALPWSVAGTAANSRQPRPLGVPS